MRPGEFVHGTVRLDDGGGIVPSVQPEDIVAVEQPAAGVAVEAQQQDPDREDEIDEHGFVLWEHIARVERGNRIRVAAEGLVRHDEAKRSHVAILHFPQSQRLHLSQSIGTTM